MTTHLNAAVDEQLANETLAHTEGKEEFLSATCEPWRAMEETHLSVYDHAVGFIHLRAAQVVSPNGGRFVPNPRRKGQVNVWLNSDGGQPNDFWCVYKVPNDPFFYGSDRNGGLYTLKEQGSGCGK